MRAVNLLPVGAYAPKQRLPHAPVVLAATVPVLAGALVYLGYSVEHSKVTDRQSNLSVVQAQITALAPSPELVAESSKVGSERTTREAALNDALTKRMDWHVMMDRLSRVLPPGAWLSSLTAASPTPASSTTAAPNPNGFSLQGYADSEATVATVLSRLALVPGLSDVVLGGTTTTTVGTNRKLYVQFTINAGVGASS